MIELNEVESSKRVATEWRWTFCFRSFVIVRSGGTDQDKDRPVSPLHMANDHQLRWPYTIVLIVMHQDRTGTNTDSKWLI